MRRMQSSIAGIALLCISGLSAKVSIAVDRMVGLIPSDGTTAFVKKFSVGAGTTILGVEFVNNDARTVFPAVTIVQGPLSKLSDGSVIASMTNVVEGSDGVVRTQFPETIEVSASSDYYVVVRIPEGTGKLGPGDGPAIGAYDLATAASNYGASGPEGSLTPVSVNLAIELVTTGMARKSGSETTYRTFLGQGKPNPFNPMTTIELGVEGRRYVKLSIYNVAGRLVRRFDLGNVDAGVHQVVWDGLDNNRRSAPTGVYVVELSVDGTTFRRKLSLIK